MGDTREMGGGGTRSALGICRGLWSASNPTPWGARTTRAGGIETVTSINREIMMKGRLMGMKMQKNVCVR